METFAYYNALVILYSELLSSIEQTQIDISHESLFSLLSQMKSTHSKNESAIKEGITSTHTILERATREPESGLIWGLSVICEICGLCPLCARAAI